MSMIPIYQAGVRHPTLVDPAGLTARIANVSSPYPLLGGSLSTGPTGLSGLAGQYPGVGPLPFRSGVGGLVSGPAGPGGLPRLGAAAFQRLGPIEGLAGQVPMGAGRAAAADALSLIPEAAAGGGGRAAGLAAQARGALPSLALNPNMGRMAMAGRVGGAGLLGSLGSTAIDALNPGGQNSNLEQGLQGAAQGAGIGAGIGSIVPGIGTGVGAAVGGVAGGALGVLGNMFGGGGEEEEADPLQTLATAMTSANLSPDATENILTTYETLMALAEQQEGDLKEQAQQAAFEQTSALILQTMQQEQAEAEMVNGLNGPGLLAMQQQAQQIFEPIAQDIEANASLYAQAVAGLRDQLPADYRAVADTQVARELTSADKLANAYRAQAALTPIAERLTGYQQQQEAFARQQYQQMLAQQAAGATAGAGGVQDILAQMG